MDDCFAESLVYSESENSESEETPKSTPILKNPVSTSIESASIQSQSNKISDQSDDDDDDYNHINKSVKTTRKNAKILSSDEEESYDQTLDSHDSLSNEEQDTAVMIRPSICDSDTNSSSDKNKTDVDTRNMIKKLKKKKPNARKSSNSQSDSDSESEKGDDTKKSNRKKSSLSQSSNSSSADSNDNEDGAQDIESREKPVQRISAKIAEQQMKEIQSESQRMARQIHVNIPYHKPKQHSLKEFLSRRSIVQQHEKLTFKPIVKAAVAIKMTGEDLVKYMADLEERTKEANEFFTEENESTFEEHHSDEIGEVIEDGNTESKSTEILHTSISDECQTGDNSTNFSPNNAIEEPTSDLKCTDDTNNHNEDQNMDQTECNRASDVIEIHTVRTELDDELDLLVENEMKTKNLSIQTKHIPKLQGDRGLLIDFETNDLRPIPKTGVEELLTRFVKNALVKRNVAETQDVSIFRTDTGTVETHTVHVSLDDKKSSKELRPGESLLKLRSELGMKIKENREKIIAQRLKEEKEQEIARKQIESEDENEDFDDVSDSEKSFAEAMSDQENITNEENNEERTEEETKNDNEGIDDKNEKENSDQNESESSDVDLESNVIQKSRKRIVAMDDSDDDSIQQISANTGTNTETDIALQHIDNLGAQQTLDESSKSLNSHDLSALESEILQLNSLADSESNKKEASKLFQIDTENDEEIGESQLLALCSGSFATQNLDINTATCAEVTQNKEPKKLVFSEAIDSEKATTSKSAFLSSDEDDVDEGEELKAKKKRMNTLVYSDDEGDENNDALRPEKKGKQSRSVGYDEESDDESEEGEKDDEDERDEEGEVERYIEYDSDENEVEVELKKSDVQKKASEYFEKEAELSESEWGSDDEDEKGMNRYEAELGDLDNFDKNKLRDELERIRLREQIDDDAREIRILTERFFEEEDNGQERERKFRWKHLNNGDIDQPQSIEQDEIVMPNSDDENEAEWRRVRYEREQLLKQQTTEKDSFIERTSNVIEVTEQITVENTSLNLNSCKRITVMKPIGYASSKTTSPFLISKSDLSIGHLSRKSFLNRDNPLLEKLVGLSKVGNENDAVLKTAKGKGNYVFTTSEKKDSSKRKSENESGHLDSINPSKKSKLEPHKNRNIRPQTKAFFESLN